MNSPARTLRILTPRRLCIALALLLAALTLAAYAPLANNGFISFDDPDYVLRNEPVRRGFSPDGVRWSFTTMHAANWHPLTWLSHMLDCQLFGIEPGGHHLVNLLLHIASTLLLLTLFVRLTGSIWRSTFVAALSALHPAHVESVAWISERKDVLSAVFAMLTLHAYVSYVRAKNRAYFGLTILLFALGLMAKPMLVTLPFVLLLIDRWPLQRTESAIARVREKWPLFVLTIASCVVTYWAQHFESVVSFAHLPFPQRLANASVAYLAYLGKIIWPHDLALPYPWTPELSALRIFLSVAVLLAITVAAWLLRRRAPWLLVGWFWFAGMLVPVIGIVQVGGQAMADRYTYLPGIGVFVAVTWSVGEIVALRGAARFAVAAMGCVIVTALAMLTFRQSELWRDDVTLFEHAALVTQNNFYALSNAALGRASRGDLELAQRHYEAALKLWPNHPQTLNNFGVLLRRMDRNDEALAAFRAALQASPDDQEALYNLAISLAQHGDDAPAVAAFEQLLKARPDIPRAHYRLGLLLEKLNRNADAQQHYREALRLSPNDAEVKAKLESPP